MWCRSIAPGGARVGEYYLGYWLAQSNQWYGAVLLCVWACCWLLADQAGDEQPPPSPASVFSTAMFFCAVCHCTSFYTVPRTVPVNTPVTNAWAGVDVKPKSRSKQLAVLTRARLAMQVRPTAITAMFDPDSHEVGEVKLGEVVEALQVHTRTPQAHRG